jgi:hypothetical protein
MAFAAVLAYHSLEFPFRAPAMNGTTSLAAATAARVNLRCRWLQYGLVLKLVLVQERLAMGTKLWNLHSIRTVRTGPRCASVKDCALMCPYLQKYTAGCRHLN